VLVEVAVGEVVVAVAVGVEDLEVDLEEFEETEI